MKAYHITTKSNWEKIKRKGMKGQSYWFPEKIFPNAWKKDFAEDLVSHIENNHKETDNDKLVVLCAEINAWEDVSVNSIRWERGYYETEKSVLLCEYLQNNLNFPVPELFVKNRIPQNRISLYIEVNNFNSLLNL